LNAVDASPPNITGASAARKNYGIWHNSLLRSRNGAKRQERKNTIEISHWFFINLSQGIVQF
jgi:hypothetical protein